MWKKLDLIQKNKDDMRGISIMHKRTKTRIVNDLFNDKNNQIEYEKFKMGIFWKNKDLKYKFDNKLLKKFFDNIDDENGFLVMKNAAIAVVDHPTFFIEFNSNKALNTILYFTKTKGKIHKFVYFDISENRIYVNHQHINTIELENIKIGSINISTIENGSIVESIFKSEEDYVYYEFNSELDRTNIIENVLNESDQEVLLSILDSYECNNFEEIKRVLLTEIIEKSQSEDIPVILNGVNITNGEEVYNNLTDTQKGCVSALMLKFVDCFEEIIEKIEK